MDDCIFCKISNGKIPATVLYEDSDIMAILDIMPANYGHVLVLTKIHFEFVFDVPQDIFLKVSSLVHRLTCAMKSALVVDGFNLLQNNGKAAGQLIPHFHFHIIPRISGDKVTIAWDHLTYRDNGEATALVIKEKMQSNF